MNLDIPRGNAHRTERRSSEPKSRQAVSDPFFCLWELTNVHSASSVTSPAIVSVTAKKRYVFVMGSFVTKADDVDSVRKQNPANARPVAASNILLGNVLTSQRVLAEIGMPHTVVQDELMLIPCSGSEDHMAKECDKPRPCNNCDQPGHTARSVELLRFPGSKLTLSVANARRQRIGLASPVASTSSCSFP